MKKSACLFLFLLIILVPTQLVRAAEVYDCRPVPEGRSIAVDGCSEERDWEEALLVKADMPDGAGTADKYALIKVLCDRQNLYLQLYVIDDDRAEFCGVPDGVTMELTEDGLSRSFRCDYNGAVRTGGFEYASLNNDCYYRSEVRVAFLKRPRDNEFISLRITVDDNSLFGAHAQNVATEKEISLRMIFDEPAAAKTTAVKTTEGKTTKPQKTVPETAVRTRTTVPGTTVTIEETGAAVRTQTQASPPSVHSDQTTLPQSAAGTCIITETMTGQSGQTALTYIPQGEDIASSRVFAALGAFLLLSLGVFIIVFLRRDKPGGER